VATKQAWPARSTTKARNRQSLISAARELVRQHGYAGASVESIAARAGLTTGAIYSIFGSKLALLTEVLEPAHVPSMTAEAADPSRDMVAVFEAFARSWAARLRSPRARSALELSLELQLATLRDKKVFAEAKAAFALGKEDLAAEIAAAADARGVTLPADADDLATSLIAAMQGLTQLALIVDGVADKEIFAAVARRLLAR